MTDDSPSSPGIRVPPPTFFALPLGVAWGLGRVQALPALPQGLRPAGVVAGWVLIVAAGVLGAWAILRFLRRGTAVFPHHPATALVIGGPYRLSRNPMYVGLTALYLGVALLGNLGWAPLLLPLPLAVVALWIVPAEERYLEARFGQAYRDYRGRVRRWL